MSRILFFDGVCSLCNGFVDFLIRRKSVQDLKFASLQGEAAQQMLPERHIKELNSVVLLEEGIIYTESEAALRAIGGPAKAFLYLPESIRNFLYRLIAKYRYKLFGKRDSCRIPSPEERNRFLD